MTIKISNIQSTPRRLSSTTSSQSTKKDAVVYGKCECDSHADTIAAGSNCVVLNYTGKVCDVSPYRDDYEAVTNVPIVSAATAWQSHETGQTYILVFNEELWMGDSMDYTLFNPNQLRHYGTKVQDNPVAQSPLSIISDDEEFCLELSMNGTIVYFDSHTPTEKELLTCPHIVLSSPHPWDPTSIKFPKISRTLDEEMGGIRFVSGLTSSHINVSGMTSSHIFDEVETAVDVFNLNRVTKKISSMHIVDESKILTYEKDFTPTSDTPVCSHISKYKPPF